MQDVQITSTGVMALTGERRSVRSDVGRELSELSEGFASLEIREKRNPILLRFEPWQLENGGALKECQKEGLFWWNIVTSTLTYFLFDGCHLSK